MSEKKLILVATALAGAAAAAAVVLGSKKDGGEKPAKEKAEKKPAAAASKPAARVDDPDGEGSLNLTIKMKAEGLSEKFMVNIVIENVAGASLGRTTYFAPNKQIGNLKDGTATATLGNNEEMTISGIPNYTDYSVEVVPVVAAEYNVTYDNQRGTLAADGVVTVNVSQ